MFKIWVPWYLLNSNVSVLKIPSRGHYWKIEGRLSRKFKKKYSVVELQFLKTIIKQENWMSALWLRHMKYTQSSVIPNKNKWPKCLCHILKSWEFVFYKIFKIECSQCLSQCSLEITHKHGCIKLIEVFHTWKQI